MKLGPFAGNAKCVKKKALMQNEILADFQGAA